MKTFFEKVDWEKEFIDMSVNDMWRSFRIKIEEAKSKFVPKTIVGENKRKKWLDKCTLTSVRKKHRLYAKWLETKTGETYMEYKKALNKLCEEKGATMGQELKKELPTR